MGQTLDPIFQIGKMGVSPDLIEALDKALEARELIKINVLENCEELDGDTYHHAGMYSQNYPIPMTVVLGIDITF